MTLHCVLDNQLAEISRLVYIITDFGKKQCFPKELVHDVNLVLEEVVSNIILYGYTDEERHQIELDIWCSDQELVIQVRDDAKAFNPLDSPDPDLDLPLEDRPIGGLGIYLTRQLIDRLHYTREQGKNILTLKKYIGKNRGKL